VDLKIPGDPREIVPSAPRPRSKGSLRRQIITWSFVPTALILVLAALVSLYAYQRVTESLVLEKGRGMAELSADLVAADLAAYTDPLSERFLAVFDSVIALGPGGTTFSADLEPDVANPAWLSGLVAQAQGGGAAYSNVVVEGTGGEKMIVAIIPSQGGDGKPVSGLAGIFRLTPAGKSPLVKSMEGLRRDAGHSLYLVDARGQVIYHSDADLIGRQLASQPAVRKALTGDLGALRTRDLAGQSIVASFAPVPGTTWALVSEESWGAVSAASRQYSRFSLLLLALAVVVPTVIVAVGVRRITRPIGDLSRAARRVAEGQFDQRIVAPAGGELEELVEQFNLMAGHLQESYAHLEQKVAGRTRELATVNAIAAEASSSLDLKQVLGSALQQILDVMGMERGEAYRVDETSGELVLIAHRGLSDEAVRRTARHPLGCCPAGQAAEEGRPIVRHIAACPASEWKESMLREGIRLVVSVPLQAKGRHVGVIDLQAQTPRIVTPEELSLLTAIGQQIGLAVENARLYEQAQQLAIVRERGRLARDLHDSVTQTLYGATLCAEAAARQLSMGQTDRAAEHLREIRTSTQTALREMRLLIFELRPGALKRDGLATALQSRLEAVEQRGGLAAELKVNGSLQLSAEAEIGLYRIAQEALNNVLRHSHARSVVVSLQQRNGLVTLEVADDGQGFDPSALGASTGFGLSGIEERAARLGGRLSIDSAAGTGTRVRVEVPA